MATSYTYAQLKRIWLNAAKGTKYDNNAWASLMAAIALAESGGRPNATNPTDNNGTQTSWGLWQISTGTHAEPSPNWNNPVVNAQLAIGKLNSQGLGAWGTYDSGAYKAYLNNNTTAAGSIPQITGASAASTQGAVLTAETRIEQAKAKTECALGYRQHFGIFFGVSGPGPTVSFCVASKTQVRALLGGAVLVVGGITAIVGLSFLGIMVLGPQLTQKVAGGVLKGVDKVGGVGVRTPKQPVPVYTGKSPSGTKPPPAEPRPNVRPAGSPPSGPSRAGTPPPRPRRGNKPPPGAPPSGRSASGTVVP